MQPYLEQLSNTLHDAIDGMGDEQLLRAPEGKWCAAEILEHLRLTYTGTAKMLEKNGGVAVIEPAQIDERMRTGRKLILEEGRFFQGLQAPTFAVPKTAADAGVRTRVFEDLKRLDDALAEAEHRRGKDANLGNHFALGPLTGDQWRHFHYEHGRHHATQIQALRAFTAKV